jgi:hypothetical protein
VRHVRSRFPKNVPQKTKNPPASKSGGGLTTTRLELNF